MDYWFLKWSCPQTHVSKISVCKGSQWALHKGTLDDAYVLNGAPCVNLFK